MIVYRPQGIRKESQALRGVRLALTVALMAGMVTAVLAAPPALAQRGERDATPVITGSSPDGTVATDEDGEGTSTDPILELQKKRDEIGTQLRDISQSIGLSQQRAAEIEQTIAALVKTESTLRDALIESAARRKELEARISKSEETLAGYGLREDAIRESFKERRAILAEVLAALQRMGRNPPPALLVRKPITQMPLRGNSTSTTLLKMLRCLALKVSTICLTVL